EQIDRNGDGIELAEVEFYDNYMTAQKRSGWAAQKLRFDLDGDLMITRDEVEKVVLFQRGRLVGSVPEERLKRELAKSVDQIMQADSNQDGRLEGPEIYTAIPQQTDYARTDRNSAIARALLALDPNGDNRLTEVESFAILGKAFEGADFTAL